jgi:Major tropism determinant N-terminal domain
MATQVQYRRGSSTQVAAFTGALGEMVVDTTNWVLNVCDGVTVGGFNMVGVTATQTLTNKTLTAPILAGNANVQGNIIGSGAISITGNVTSGSITLAATGNVNCGNINNAGANGVGNIGTSTTYFNTVFAKATSAQYADLAEMYVADQTYTPGTVIEFGGNEEVTASHSNHSTAVAGIVSTNPSYLMNATQTGNHVVAVALVGRVPCQVVGTFKKGDRLVSSDITGVATGLDNAKYQPGCIIGKALEAYDSTEVGTVEVAVGRT